MDSRRMDSALGRHFADFGDFRATADLKSSSTLKSPKLQKRPPQILESLKKKAEFLRHCEPMKSAWQSTSKKTKNAKSGF